MDVRVDWDLLFEEELLDKKFHFCPTEIKAEKENPILVQG